MFDQGETGLTSALSCLVCMLANGCYFLFFCRGFKLVGPMVIMIYRFEELTAYGKYIELY